MSSRRVIAYFTDPHIGQKVAADADAAGSKMSYTVNGHEHKSNLDVVVSDITARGVTEAIFGGDVGTPQSNEWFFAQVKGKFASFDLTLGNHDSIGRIAGHFDTGVSIAKDKYYHLRQSAHFDHVVLDTSSNAMDDAQLQWFAEVLGQSRRPLILFVHHPVLPVASSLDKSGASLQGRLELQRLLLESRRRIDIFCGHYHMSDLAKIDGVTQHLTFAVSYQIEKNALQLTLNHSAFGYRLITLDGDEVATDTILFNAQADGAARDMKVRRA